MPHVRTAERSTQQVPGRMYPGAGRVPWSLLPAAAKRHQWLGLLTPSNSTDCKHCAIRLLATVMDLGASAEAAACREPPRPPLSPNSINACML